MIMTTTLRRLVLILIASCTFLCAQTDGQKSYQIGVLAYRGDVNAITRWEPTAQYLSKKLAPLRFEIKTLEYCEIENAIKNKDVDFFIANPAIYVNLEHQYGASRIATLKNKGADGQDQTMYTTVIFTTKDNAKINSIPDLKNKKFAAVHKESFGGWIITQKELLSHNLDPKKQLKEIVFFATHDRVVEEVLAKRADAGAVRTEILEKMATEGKIDLKNIKIINPRTHSGFKYLHSGDLYPEWAFAKAEATPVELSDKVLIELLNVKPSDEAAMASQTNGWTTPQVYEPVRQCLKELKLKPYEKAQFSLGDFIVQYKYQVIAFSIFTAVLLASLFFIIATNRKLDHTKTKLEIEIDHKKEIESSLIARQVELDHLNSFLEEKIMEKSEELLNNAHEKVKSYQELVDTLVTFVEKRDTYTAGHSRRVSNYCKLIAVKMGLSEQLIDLLSKAAILHDIGKIGTPDSILLKPDKLTGFEYDIIKTHVSVGAEMIASIRGYEQLAVILENHHERYDGTGYPGHKKADEIPMLSHIMIVADSFDAMTTNRIYKNKKTTKEAFEELGALSGSFYHPDVVRAAQKALEDVYIEEDIDQLPMTDVEQERFSYFFKDSLTGAYNERYYRLICQGNVKSKNFIQKTDISLKNFTQYNKLFGWEMGSKLLCDLAAELHREFGQATIFRIHGDDFIMLFEQVTEVSEEGLNQSNGLRGNTVQARAFSLTLSLP
jgi:putative nucleotidyltransferase with HDIG domain